MRTAAGYKSSRAFISSQEVMKQEITEVNIFEAHLISDLDNDDNETHASL